MTRSEIDEKIKEITDKIVTEYNPEKIILFGSYAWGTPGPDSDVDLFIVKESNDRRIERERRVQRILYGSKMPVDVLVYTPKEINQRAELDDFFINRIIKRGSVLYPLP